MSHRHEEITMNLHYLHNLDNAKGRTRYNAVIEIVALGVQGG